MAETSFIEEIDCGSFFDHIDDLLEFPNDDVENVVVGNGKGGGSIGYDEFSPLWPGNSLESELGGSEPVFSGANSNSASDLSAELSVPYEDIVQLEWLSTFVEDSFTSGGLTVEKSPSNSFTKDSKNQFQTSSPVSVLESSSACSNNGKTIPISHEKRARSKRPRPAAFTPRLGIQLTSPTSSTAEAPDSLNASSESESFVESSCPLKKAPIPVPAEPQKKKKKIKIVPPSGLGLGFGSRNQNENPNASSNPPSQAVRKCMHCDITKTPQWRAGPMGPKTLCNACGVRYKSGRLFPEYRPAASPTFVPSLHSNSHKKVLEMRCKTNEEKSPMAASRIAASTSCPPKFIPRSDLLPTYM